MGKLVQSAIGAGIGDGKVERQIAVAHNCHQLEGKSFKRLFFEALMALCPPIGKPGCSTDSDVQGDPAEECGSGIVLEEMLEEDMRLKLPSQALVAL